MSRAVDDLLAVLDVEQLENNLFRGRSPQVGWVPLLVQQLIPEEEHLVFQEGPVQLFELAIAQRLAEVDALNLGANAGRNASTRKRLNALQSSQNSPAQCNALAAANAPGRSLG